MARSRMVIEEEMRRHLRELWLLVQDWYEAQGVKADPGASDDIAQNYGSASFSRMADGHWKGGLYNSATLTLRNPAGGKVAGDVYIDIGPKSDELYWALERHNKDKGKNTEVNVYDGFECDGNRCPDD